MRPKPFECDQNLNSFLDCKRHNNKHSNEPNKALNVGIVIRDFIFCINRDFAAVEHNCEWGKLNWSSISTISIND